MVKWNTVNQAAGRYIAVVSAGGFRLFNKGFLVLK
jgi:hypothetical protein